MKINEHFQKIVSDANGDESNASNVLSQRDKLFRENIVPALVKKGANDSAILVARTNWNKQTDSIMQNAGLIPKAGQSSRSFQKDKRADRAVNEAEKTGSKLPIIKETALSTLDTIGNAFGQGVGSMIESSARWANDLGDNEKGSKLDQAAEYGANLRKGYESSASTVQKETQQGKNGKAAQLGIGAIQSMPAMAMPMGVAGGVGKVALKVPALAAKAPYLGLGAGIVAGHTQNYGEVRRSATENLKRDFPTWKEAENVPEYKNLFQQKIDAGMPIEQAQKEAHETFLDNQSEAYAEKYGRIMTGLDVIAPSGAALGSKILKTDPNSTVAKVLIGSPNKTLVHKKITEAPRVGITKLLPDTNLATNKLMAGMVARQALEEGTQGAVGEYGGQAASADVGGQAVKWGDVGKSFIEEGIMGGIMGGGMQSMSRDTPTGQAQLMAKQLQDSSNRVIQMEAEARNELSTAMQLNNPEAIESAKANLSNIGIEVKKVQKAYGEYNAPMSQAMQNLAKQYVPEEKAVYPTPPMSEREKGWNDRALQQQKDQEQQKALAEQQAIESQQAVETQPAVSTPSNPYMADTTSLVMDGVSKGFLTPDEAGAIQSDPIRGQVFTLAQQGDKAAAHNLVMDAVSSGQVNDVIAQDLIQSIDRYSDLSTPKKPSLSGIVNNHVKNQVQQPYMGGTWDNGIQVDPETFESVHPTDPDPMDAFSQPKVFSNRPKAQDYINRNGLIDSHELHGNADGMVEVRPISEVPQILDPIQDITPVKEIQSPGLNMDKPKVFNNLARAHVYLKENNLQETHETHSLGDGRIQVRPKSDPKQQATNPEIESVQTPAEELIAESTPQVEVEDSRSFQEKILDAHANNPKIKPKLISDEIAKGRPRAEVLAEVTEAVKSVKDKPNTAVSDEKPSVAPKPEEKNEKEQIIDKNGISKNTQSEGDIGRGSDGKPFANQSAAKIALNKKGLEKTHEVVKIAPSQFVLREKEREVEVKQDNQQPEGDAQQATEPKKDDIVEEPTVQTDSTKPDVEENSNAKTTNVANDTSAQESASQSPSTTPTEPKQTTEGGQRRGSLDTEPTGADPVTQNKPEREGNASTGSTKPSNDTAPTTTGRLDATVQDDIGQHIEQSNQPLDNFKITEDLSLGEGSLNTKFNANIEAIKLVQKLDAEQRTATPEEREIIAKYVGWGGLSQAFAVDGQYPKGWEEKGNLLKSLLSEDDYKNASGSTTSAFYTPINITKAIWSAVEKLGYSGGLVLEPSVGTGNFLGLAPELPQKFIASEMDGITSRIAQHLYPQSKVFHAKYENIPLRDGSFDLAIGNPPYGSAQGHFKDKPHLNGLNIHNQFMLGTIENLKSGGVSAMIVTHSFMDSKDKQTRLAIAKQANLIAGLRLPANTFKGSANTEVITDILLFQKKPITEIQEIEEKGLSTTPEWVESNDITNAEGESVAFNDYFSQKNSNILGQVQFSKGFQGMGVGFTVKHDGDIQAGLNAFIDGLPQVIAPKSLSEITEAINKDYEESLSHLSIGMSGLEIGAVGRDENGQLFRVVEQEAESGHILKKQSITPKTVWSKTLDIDAQGNYYKVEPKLDDKGKKVYQKDENGRDTKRIVYERVIVPEEKISTQSRLGETGFKVLEKLTDLRDLLRDQLNKELSDSADIESNRQKLKEKYDQFVQEHGYINSPKNAKYVDELPDASLMFALESGFKREIKEVTGKTTSGKNRFKVVSPDSASPADILTKRVIFKKGKQSKAATAIDGVSLSLAYTGKVNLDLISQLTGKTVDDLIKEMYTDAETPLVFKDPSTNEWVTSQKYLSGNVRQKLRAAQHEGLSKNIAALERVLPKEIELDNITLSMGMHWIPTSVYAKFVTHLTDDQSPKVNFEPILGLFEIGASPSKAKAEVYGTPRASVEWLVDRILNNKSIRIMKRVSIGRDEKTVLDQEATESAVAMADQIKLEFSDWVYGQAEVADQLKTLFNEKYNNIVKEKFDGSHLQFIGKVPDYLIELRTHQVNAVWRGVTTNFVLYDHAVGSGKTFTGIARAMERKRLGLSNKPTIVVPNHMVEQFASDIYRLYPSAKVLAAGKKDFEKKNRKRLFAKIATGDYDIIVVPHSSFEFIKLSAETEARYMEQELDSIISAIQEAKRSKGDKRHTIKQLEETRSRISAKLEAKRNTKRKDKELTFEQLGIDDITVDEAHEFKNLFYHSNLSNVIGMGNPSGSGKAFDLFNKFRYLHEIGGSGSFMTGTPISNSAVEMHTMMRYLMPDTLRDYGLERFDNWAKLYADNTSKFESTESGRLKQVTRFARDWKNMRSLMDLWYSVVDPITNEDVKKDYLERKGTEFPLPQLEGGKRQSIVVEPTDTQMDILQTIIDGFDSLDTISDSTERNAERLRLMDRARKLSLDPRAVDPVKYADAKGGKLDAVANKVYEVYKQWNADKGTQIIFLDRSVPKSKGTDKILKEYDEILSNMEKAEQNGDLDTLGALQDKLDKFDSNEINELRLSQNSTWNAYDEIKGQLIKQGIPANEIAFVQDANNDAQKQDLFNQVKTGEVRVIIGSTPRMGAGTNIQDRLVHLHHVDVTWKPSDIEQREGRIIRQGNLLYKKYGHDNFRVGITAYVTERTTDAKLWDVNSAKLKTINGIRHYSGDFNLDFGEDADNVSMQEISALASGNPLMLERVTLDSEIQQLHRMKKTHDRRVASFVNQVSKAKKNIAETPARIESYKPTVEEVRTNVATAVDEINKQTISIDGQTFNGRGEAELHIEEKYNQAKKAVKEGEKVKVQYDVAGEAVSSMTKAKELIKSSFSMNEPMSIEFKGTSYNSSLVFANENFGESTPSWLSRSNPEPVLKLFGVPIVVDVANEHGALTATTLDGKYDLVSYDFNPETLTATKLSSMLRGMANSIKSQADTVIGTSQRKMKDDQDIVKELEPKLSEKFSKETELEQKQNRLKEVTELLSDKDEETGQQPEESKYSRSENFQNGSTVEEVREILVNRFGQDAIASLEKKGSLSIIDSYKEKGIEGFAEGGKVTLVADHLNSESIIPTFLHELGGHVGMQGVLKPSAYANLMSDFKRLVEAKNPEALEAKRLAERENNADAVNDEYLPYLITIAAKRQNKQGAIQRFTSRILSAIKAWAVHRLGLNLKLTPSDILALSERMIKTISKKPTPPAPKGGKRYSRVDNPADQSKPAQRQFIHDANQYAVGRMALSSMEKSKTLSRRTLNLFNTMLHKALKDESGDFKKTFDLVQDKINHVTFASSVSMEQAPDILTQLESWGDYKTEAKRVGAQVANAVSLGKIEKSKFHKDLDKVGQFMFEKTLQDVPKTYKAHELRKRGWDDQQIDLYMQARSAIDSSLDTFARTTMANIYKHMGGGSKEMIELMAKDLNLDQHVEEIRERIGNLAGTKPELKEAAELALDHIDKVYERVEDLKDSGYMPLMRFGKYFIRVHNPTTGEVAYRQHFESESERNLAFKNYDQSKLPAGYELESSQINELEHKLFQGVSPETVAMFAKEAGLPLGDAETAYIKHAIRDNHALKRLLKRQGIDGFDTDFKRVLASFVLSNSRYSANQLYNPAIDESIQDIKDPQYQEDAIRLRDYSLDTQEELSAVKNFAFVWYMGFSVMFGLVNLTQPLLQTLPYLMQYSTDWKVTGSAFLKAVKTWRKGADAMDEKYKVHYDRARREGHLDPQNTWMLQGLERGKSGMGANSWQLISHASGFFAQASETVNRRTTLFSALDVAESLGQEKLEKLGFKDAYDFAVRTIQETQGIYNKGNRPRVSRGNIGSVLMMYKQFMIAYIEQMVRMQKNGLWGGEDDEFKKKMAALVGFGISRPILIMLGTLMATSGATGLPFVRDILDIVETAGGMTGKPFNTEREVQIALSTALGHELGGSVNTALMDGFINLNPVIDVKGRMGMGDLIPATAYFSPLTSEYSKDSESNQVGGALAGLVSKANEAAALAKIGAYGEGAVQLMPKAITSVMQGGIAATTGDYRNMKTGVKTNDATVLDGIVKILDAQPSKIAKEGRIRGFEMKDKAAVQSVNALWKQRYEDALESKDPAQIKAIKEEIKAYNDNDPRYPITFNQKRADTNFAKSNMSWQEKRKDAKGLEWMNDYNDYL